MSLEQLLLQEISSDTHLMINSRAVQQPTIIYRPVRPSDLDALESIHAALFPIRYEKEFFLNVVNSHGIVSWAAVDISRSSGQNDKHELIGFVTTRLILANESEIHDLVCCNGSRLDLTLVYILTLGVVESYRNLGIASSLVHEVIKYASSIANCRAVYLHVIDYNHQAISFYRKMSFKLIRRLYGFYYIMGRHYDSYLFVYYVNGGRSRCSPLEILAAVATYIKGLVKVLAAKFRRKEELELPTWIKCKETTGLLGTLNRTIISGDDMSCENM